MSPVVVTAAISHLLEEMLNGNEQLHSVAQALHPVNTTTYFDVLFVWGCFSRVDSSPSVQVMDEWEYRL